MIYYSYIDIIDCLLEIHLRQIINWTYFTLLIIEKLNLIININWLLIYCLEKVQIIFIFFKKFYYDYFFLFVCIKGSKDPKFDSKIN
jgi:hypothetical protein